MNDPLSSYLNTVFYCPEYFIVTSYFDKLCQYTIESLFQHKDVVPVQITGPKGVGKSTSLFSLAVNLMKHCQESDTVVLYFTERSFSCSWYITQKYLKANELTCTEDTIAETLVLSKDRNFVVCADIGKCNSRGGMELLCMLDTLMGNFEHIKLIVALSSGKGIDDKNKEFYQRLKGFGSDIVEITNFSEEEAKQFVTAYNLDEIGLDQLKRMTNFNPSLLQIAEKVKRQRWESKCDNIFEQHLETSICREIEIHTVSTFDVAEKISKIDFLKQLSNTDYFLYHAKNDGVLKIQELRKFLESWVHEDGHCYVSSIDQNGFTIALNFPNADQFISRKIASLVADISIGEAGGALQLGYYFETQLYRAFQQCKKLGITYDQPAKSVSLMVNFCSTQRISTLVVGGLYKLYHQHPVIDFVGLFQGSDRALYLLMVQASLSTYIDHKAKLSHLSKTYDKYDEFKSTSVLDYYKNLCGEPTVIYVYVSPKEEAIPTSLQKHQNECKLNLKLGYICDSDENCISCTLAKFKL